MFGRKSRLEKLRALARADYLRCQELNKVDRYNRMFVSRIARRAKTNLDKIFVQGAKAEEARQLELITALKSGSKTFPKRAKHDGFNTLRGTTGTVLSWVPEQHANTMFNLGADYQIQDKKKSECIAAADRIAKSVADELQTVQDLELLHFLRVEMSSDSESASESER